MTRTREAIALAVIVSAALWLRADGVGHLSFDTDEYYHVFAAQELAQGHEALLPSGHVYNRAFGYTWLVSKAFALGDVSETSARMPSVVTGILVVLAVWWIGRCWFGPAAGLIAAALVAAAPLMVSTSRLCRMYGVFQLLYLLALFSYERGWERAGAPLRRRVLWTAVAGLSLFGALHMHNLAMLAGPAIAAYWAVRALARPRSRYAAFLAAGIVLGLAVWATGLIDVERYWRLATYAPRWAADRRAEVGFYVRDWAADVPWLWWVMPVAAVFVCARHRWLGWFAVCQFAVPFLLHSTVLDWKAQRYVSHLFPLAALVVAPFIVWMVQAIAASKGRVTAAIAATAVAAVAIAPVLSQSLRAWQEPFRPRWREAYAFVAPRLALGDALMSSVPLSTYYYLGRPATHMLNNYGLDFEEKMVKDAAGFWIDWYAGIPLVTSLDEFLRVTAAYPRTWLVVNRGRFRSDLATPPDLREHVMAQCRAHHPLAGDTTVFVFECGAADG